MPRMRARYTRCSSTQNQTAIEEVSIYVEHFKLNLVIREVVEMQYSLASSIAAGTVITQMLGVAGNLQNNVLQFY